MNVYLSDFGLTVIDKARKYKGWNKYDKRWFIEAGTCESTLKRFWLQRPIRADNFIRFCGVLGIDDWQSLAVWV